jgi:hypothetical protein
MPDDAGRATRREGASRVRLIHPTWAEATEAARGIAIRERVELLIHGRTKDANSLQQRPLLSGGALLQAALFERGFFFIGAFATQWNKECCRCKS